MIIHGWGHDGKNCKSCQNLDTPKWKLSLRSLFLFNSLNIILRAIIRDRCFFTSNIFRIFYNGIDVDFRERIDTFNNRRNKDLFIASQKVIICSDEFLIIDD